MHADCDKIISFKSCNKILNLFEDIHLCGIYPSGGIPMVCAVYMHYWAICFRTAALIQQYIPPYVLLGYGKVVIYLHMQK